MHERYEELAQHAFARNVLVTALKISREITEPSGFSLDANYKRNPAIDEFYCLQLGYYISHFLTVLQQMEHTIFYLSNFSPTEKMKKAGINRANHLIWSVENYIIRTQTAYDRLLIVIDRLFNLHNATNKISHEQIISNMHISRTDVPKYLKRVRKSIKKYYYDRNKIMHEASFMEEELNRIEGLSILVASGEYEGTDNEFLKEDIKFEVRKYVKKKKAEFQRINRNLFSAVQDLFDVLSPIYERKYKELSGV